MDDAELPPLSHEVERTSPVKRWVDRSARIARWVLRLKPPRADNQQTGPAAPADEPPRRSKGWPLR